MSQKINFLILLESSFLWKGIVNYCTLLNEVTSRKILTLSTEPNLKRFDQIILFLIGSILLYSATLLLAALTRGEDLGTWIWNRHQNQFSWFSRPIFIIPACYYAYRRMIWHVLGFMGLLGTSLFWFPSPAQVPVSVSKYLEWEKQLFFTNESPIPLVVLSITVTVFLLFLFVAFWQRKAFYGLLLINIGTILKIVTSLILGKEVGSAAIVPSLSSILVIDLVFFAIWKCRANRNRPHSR